MKEKRSNELVGILLLALGIVLAIKAFVGFTSLILFEGWWAVLIVVLAVINISKKGWNNKNGACAIAGAILFINYRTGFLGFILGKLIVPVILLAIGAHFLLKNKKQIN